MNAFVSLVLLILWCTYSLNGFRGWWQPIQLSDGDAGSGVRQMLFAGSAVVSLLLLFVSRRVWDTGRAQSVLALIAVWLLMSMLYSDQPSTTLKRAILFGCGSLTAATFVALSKQPLQRTAQSILGICSAAALVSIAWMVAFPAEITTNPGRPGLAGISNHPNTIAPAFAIGLTLALGYPTRTFRTRALVKAICLPACAVALALTTSVTSILFGLICCAVLVVLLLPAYWKTAITFLAGAFGAGIAIVGPDRVRSWILDGINRDETMSGRGELWSIIGSKVREAPFFGRGWGAFWTEGRGRELVTTWNPRQSHNAYLDVMLDVGLIGLAIFALLIIPLVLRLIWNWAKNNTDTPRSVIASLIAIVLGLFTVYALQQSFIGKVDSFAFITLLLVLASVAEESRRVKDNTDRLLNESITQPPER